LTEEKSWLGFMVFYICTLFISIYFVGFVRNIFILALIPAFTELFSFKGIDNLAIQIYSALWFKIIVNQVEYSMVNNFTLLVLMVLFISPLEKMAFCQWMYSCFMDRIYDLYSDFYGGYNTGGYVFLVGSLTSKLNKTNKDANGRSGSQVLANGIVASTSFIFFVRNRFNCFSNWFFGIYMYKSCRYWKQ
jgi:hypothetical protein